MTAAWTTTTAIAARGRLRNKVERSLQHHSCPSVLLSMRLGNPLGRRIVIRHAPHRRSIRPTLSLVERPYQALGEPLIVARRAFQAVQHAGGIPLGVFSIAIRLLLKFGIASLDSEFGQPSGDLRRLQQDVEIGV